MERERKINLLKLRANKELNNFVHFVENPELKGFQRGFGSVQSVKKSLRRILII